jgi:hypothetical protein
MFRLLDSVLFASLPVTAVVIGGLHNLIVAGFGDSSSILGGPTTPEILIPFPPTLSPQFPGARSCGSISHRDQSPASTTGEIEG